LELTKLRNNLIKFIIAISFGALAFFAARKWYFETNPLLEVSYFAEAVIALVICAIAYFFFPAMGLVITRWMEGIINKTVTVTIKKLVNDKNIRSKKIKREKKVEKEKFQKLEGAVFVDTSAIIDGRILDVAKSGFLRGKVVVPRFVVSEVQQVSDSANDLKRQRGRRGLDILNDLKKECGRNFILYESKENGEVDSLLVNYAKKYHGAIVTTDFNLNKVARVSNIKVLNINDLANSLKQNMLPQEKVLLKISQKGKESGQGVGYLDDGTMVVVENGGLFVGKEIEVEVQKVLQKESGRMIFSKILNYKP